jgi:hypothetical protein
MIEMNHQRIKEILFVMAYSLIIIFYFDIYKKERVGHFILNHMIGFGLSILLGWLLVTYLFEKN